MPPGTLCSTATEELDLHGMFPQAWVRIHSLPHKPCAAGRVPAGNAACGEAEIQWMFDWRCRGSAVQRFRCGRMPLFIRFPAGNFRSHFGYACG